MAGYAARDRPSEGALHDLWAKVLVLQDPVGRKAVLVTLDVCGIDRRAVPHDPRRREGAVRDRARPDRHRLLAHAFRPGRRAQPRDHVRQDDRRAAPGRRDLHEGRSTESIDRTMGEAFADLLPPVLFWGTGRADFAVNRRENKEKDVPALRAALALKGPGGPRRSGPPRHERRGRDDGDRLRLRLPLHGARRLQVLGRLRRLRPGLDREGPSRAPRRCSSPAAAADQNPIPRRTVELAQKYGGELAVAVEDVLATPMHVVEGPLASAYEEVPLPFASLPLASRIWRPRRKSQGLRSSPGGPSACWPSSTAKGKLDAAYPYPVQVWRLGDLTWIFLGGEVVVDYSLRLKRNLGTSTTWVSAYCNDVMAYIPSLPGAEGGRLRGRRGHALLRAALALGRVGGGGRRRRGRQADRLARAEALIIGRQRL